MISKIDAILSLVKNAQVVIDGDDITWVDPSTAPVTDLQIATELARLQADYDAKQYQRSRAKEYPTMQEQLDMQYWDSINGTSTWQEAINTVKAKYPKPQ